MTTEEFASGDDPLDNAEYLREISRRLRGISDNLFSPDIKNELTDLALHLAQRAEALAPAHDEGMPPGPGHEPHEDSEAALRQSRKMETIGRLTGGVMHDFNNLLTVIEGNLELIENMAKAAPEGGIELPRLRRLLEAAQRGLSSGGELTRRLLAFSRQEPPALRTIDLNATIAAFAPLLHQAIGHVALRLELAPGKWLCRLDPAQFEAALLNLALNARDAMSGRGMLTIATSPAVSAAGAAAAPGDAPMRQIMLSVSDTGAGMPPEIVRHIFEPFYTTKPLGKGSGLGLAQVWAFVTQSGGEIAVESEPGRGTMFRLHLPLWRRPNGGRPVQRRARPKHGGPDESRAADEEAGEEASKDEEADEPAPAALERLS
jgi:signal transduction histidine kinase